MVKSRYWILVIGGVLVVCAALSLWLLWPGDAAAQARVLSDGKVIAIVDLSQNQTFTVSALNGGENVVTVKDGKIAVTAATCPDHYCMQRGFCNSGTAVVCLPNRLVIEFVAQQEIDGAVG